MDSTFRENDPDFIESTHSKQLDKSIRVLDFNQELLNEYSKELKNNTITLKIGLLEVYWLKVRECFREIASSIT
jgi:hypothetical protein